MKRLAPLVLCLFIGFLCSAHSEIVVGSKKFTESVVLGEIIRQSLEQQGIATKHMAEVGGTRILWNALLAGNIDIYPEYTSTITTELIKSPIKDFAELQAALVQQGLGITMPLGFNNTYAIGMNKARAAALGIRKISDLSKHSDLKIGWGEEFRQRADGWPGLQAKYALPQESVRGLDHDVAYRALQAGDIDVTDLYSTDAEIEYYDLLVLEDDLKYFPRYDAVFLYRLATVQQDPKVLTVLNHLAGKISDSLMIAMNREAKITKVPSEKVAARFLQQHFSIEAHEESVGLGERLMLRTREHLGLVLVSLFCAILVAIPLGILAAKQPTVGRFVLWTVGAIQTIPSLALLVILIKPLNMLGLMGIGDTPALIALFLYSLLPIVRGAHSGFQQIPLTLRETAAVLGLSPRTRLLRIELPLALPTILSGVKTAAVMNVGFATLGALVGAGGYGQPILTGIRLDDYGLILEGALPSAALALVVQQGFDLLERLLVSPGLRK